MRAKPLGIILTVAVTMAVVSCHHWHDHPVVDTELVRIEDPNIGFIVPPPPPTFVVEDCHMEVEDIDVEPGGEACFQNASETHEVIIGFPDGSPFAQDYLKLAPGEEICLPVRGSAKGYYAFRLCCRPLGETKCHQREVGGPKIKVGC